MTLMTLALIAMLLGACVPPVSPATGQQDFPTAEFDAVEGGSDTEISPETIPLREPRECPALDSLLYQLTQADDPPLLAEQLGFKVKEDKVQVLLILASEDTDTGFLREFEAEMGTQSGSQVQAFVPIDQLCKLANTDSVLAIRPPAQAFP